MDDRVKAWLFDIQNAIDEIDQFFENHPRDFSAFQNNILLKRAIERELEIIGEAMNRILKLDAPLANKISHARNIVGLRNQVIHAYDNISDETIWSIVIRHLPLLKEEVKKLIDTK